MSNLSIPIIGRDRATNGLIPFTALQDSTTIATKNSDLVRTWKVAGIDYEMQSADDIEAEKEIINTFIRAVCNDTVAIYQHTIQRKCEAPRLRPSFYNDYARHVSDTYNKGLEAADLYVTDLYLTVVCRESNSSAKHWFKRFGRDIEQLRHDRKANCAVLDGIGRKLESSLSAYRPVVLGEYEDDNGIVCSQPLELMNYLISGFWQRVVKPSGTPLYNYLGGADIFCGTEVVEVRRPDKSKYIMNVELKDFAQFSTPGFMNMLNAHAIEYTTCTSFCGMHRHTANESLNRKMYQFENTDELEKSDQLHDMQVEHEDGLYSIGYMNFGIRVSADTVAKVKHDAALVIGELQKLGYIAVASGIATDSAYISQIPCNFDDRTRPDVVTSQNVASFMSMHNFSSGKPRWLPWGNAVLPLRNKYNRVVYLNLHSANDPTDQRGKMVPGCAALIGQTGSGKSSLLNMMNCSFPQFDNSVKPLLSLTLDIKQGSRPTIEALGGVYSALKNGNATGYNPFKLDATPENLTFLDELVVHLCSLDGNRVTTPDRKAIGLAVRTVMTMRYELRGFTTLLQNIASDGSDDSISERLKPWCSDDGTGRVGAMAWALDCPDDSLDFDKNTVFGIDGTDLLDHPTARTPVLMYLLHRIKYLLGSRRVCLLVDEAFEWINDSLIGPFIEKTLATIRSKDGIVILATQMPSSIITCPGGLAIIEQSATFIFMRNPRARFEDYEKFGMTGPEFDVLEKLSPHEIIIKQDAVSRTAMLDLSGLGAADMSILAGENL